MAEDAASHCTASYRAPELYDPPQGSTLDTRYYAEICVSLSTTFVNCRYIGIEIVTLYLFYSYNLHQSCCTRTDVWSLGCLLFAWWFGHSPFECEFHGDLVKVRIYLFFSFLGVIDKHNCDTKFCDV